MGLRRIRRVEEVCKEELSKIIHESIKDPRIGFVTITEVKVSSDLRHARVYVSIMGTEEERRETYAGLESAKGYLRTCLGKKIRLRNLPELEFVSDEVTSRALKLEGIMKELRVEEEGEAPDE